MTLSQLTAISPVDGRYRDKVDELAAFFSESGLIKYRLVVEIEYFIALCEWPLPGLDTFKPALFPALRNIYQKFGPTEAQRVKEIEAITNHDVKAVEYFLKEAFERLDLGAYKEFIHFGLTSQDINNTAVPLSLKHAIQNSYTPLLSSLADKLTGLSKQGAEIPMLARTHGQPASPTLLGKEIEVFLERIRVQQKQLNKIPFSGKFGGATGNFNAHFVAYPDIDWLAFADKFLKDKLGLERSHPTTQIEHYDNLASLFDALKRINVILLDLSKDIWQYISMEYFKQKINPAEIGSSAMPHKVNPIDFENAEGNLGIANALLEHLSAKLPISRLQRDLTDSTVLRNAGLPLAHIFIAFKSLIKGLDKLLINEAQMTADLDQNWIVIAEAIQTILRKEGFPEPYEKLKDLTRRHDKIGKKEIHTFIDQLDIEPALKERLKDITPFNYTGMWKRVGV